jgi:hypothetical protein
MNTTYLGPDSTRLTSAAGESIGLLLDAERDVEREDAGDEPGDEPEPEAWETPYLARGISPPSNYGGEV